MDKETFFDNIFRTSALAKLSPLNLNHLSYGNGLSRKKSNSSKSCNYWENLLLEKNYYSFTDCDVTNILNDRIEFLYDYYERLFENRLTPEELNKSSPTNFKGPYLPTPSEIIKISTMDISLSSLKIELQEKCQESSTLFNSHYLEAILKRWNHFKKVYDVDDLRPFLGIRCCAVTKNQEGSANLTFYRLIPKFQYINFVKYLTCDLPDFPFRKRVYFLVTCCDNFENGEFKYRNICYFSGLEYRLVEKISQRFQSSENITKHLESLIGYRSSLSYYDNLRSYSLRKFPLRDGPWTYDEDFMLINNVFKYSGRKNLEEVVNSDLQIPWKDLFKDLKTRHLNSISKRWTELKKSLLVILLESNDGCTPDFSVKQITRLIEIIYEMRPLSMGGIKWPKIANKFPGFSSDQIRRKFCYIYFHRVPPSKQDSFEESMKYLYSQVKPDFVMKQYKNRRQVKHFERVRKIMNDKRCGKKLIRRIFNKDVESGDEGSLSDLSEGKSEEAGHTTSEQNEIELASHVKTRKSHTSDGILYVDERHYNDCKIWKVVMARAGFKPKLHIECEEFASRSAQSHRKEEIQQHEKSILVEKKSILCPNDNIQIKTKLHVRESIKNCDRSKSKEGISMRKVRNSRGKIQKLSVLSSKHTINISSNLLNASLVGANGVSNPYQ